MYIITTVVITQLMFVNVGFIAYNAIRWYSYLQMQLTNYKKKIFDKDSVNDTIDYLIGNYLITENDTHNVLNEMNKSDFAVLICKGTDMVCFYPPVEEYKPEYELSDIQFISVKVEIDSVEYDVRLRTHEYTFYIVGNELNADWVRYYFCKYLKIPLSSDFKYVMTIIDDNVQFVIMNENQSLVINKDSYDIFNYVEDEDEELDEDQDEEQKDEDQDELDEDDDEELDDQNLDNEDQNLDNEDQNLHEDPTDLGLDRMIQLEDEIKEELQQQQQQEQPIEDDDLDMDKIIAEFDMSNIVIFSQDNVGLVDISNNLLEQEKEKAQGWFNLF